MLSAAPARASVALVTRLGCWLLVALLASPAAGACSSDESGGAGAGGTSGSSGAAAAGGGGTGGAAGGGATGGGGTAGGSGGTAGGDGAAGSTGHACDNPSDSVAVDASYPTVGPDGGTIEMPLNRIARQCGLDCLVEPDPEKQKECVIACLADATEGALSAGCAACVAATVECARIPCLNSCLDPNDWEGCQACLCGENSTGKNCLKDAYEPCAGIPSTTCPPG
jgi:hypothetical protein